MHHRKINKRDGHSESFSSEACSFIQEDIQETPNKQNQETPKLSAFGRFCKRMSFMKYVALLLIVPPVLNYAALKKERISLFPPEGEKVDMGWGQYMFISCIGNGLPAVILDAPTGGTSSIWHFIQEELSKITKVCVYDRAGLGFSDAPYSNDFLESDLKASHANRKIISQFGTVEQMSSDLHHLVTQAKPLTRPFILVGSEIGGLIARFYAMTHPNDVTDIVLINPLVENLFQRRKEAWNNYWNLHLLPSLQSLQLSAFVGISRIAALAGWLKPDNMGSSLPKEVEQRQFHQLCNPNHLSAVFHEHFLLNTSFAQMREIWAKIPFPRNISVTVINSKKFEKIPSHFHESWEQSQLFLRQNLHPLCQHFIFDGTLNQLYNKPNEIVRKVQQLIYKWRINFEVMPTMYTIHPQRSFKE